MVDEEYFLLSYLIFAEIEKVQVNDVQLKGIRNNTSLARKSTPQTKSTKLTDSQGTPSFRKRNCWMSSLARATNGVKTRAMYIENLEGLSEMFTTPPAVQMTNNNISGEKHSGNWLSSLAKATFGSRKRGMPVEDLQGVPEMFATPPSANTGSDCNRRSSMKSLSSTDEEAMIMNVAPVSPDKPMLLTESLEPTKTPSLRSSGVDATQIEIVSPVNCSRTPSLRSGRKQTVKSAVTPRAIIEVGEVLKPNKTPSLRNSAEDAVTIQVVTPVQPSRTPSLRSVTNQPCTQNSECSGLELEIVQAIAPSRTPSMRSAAETKAVLRKSIGNSTEDPKPVGLQGLTPRLMKSPKPQPKRYSRKSEGLQGVARLLRTPDAENDLTGDSPKLDGIKAMMQQEKSLASPYFVGLKTLIKTPKISERHMDPEGYFSAELFASPVQDFSQDTTQSVAHEKRSESVIEQTSSKVEATRLMKSPKESNSVESVENFFVPNMFASPKPQPKRYSRKSEGLQGVARLLRTPDAENDFTGDSPKLDGVKSMMQLEKSPASPHFVGLKTLMKTPKISERHMDPEGYFSAELFASPVQDFSQDTTQSVAHEKRSESVIEQTSSKVEATRLMKSPKESNSVESVENFFVPNMFASPKPQPKRYSRKSEGLQGVARLLRTPDAENDFTGDSPKLDGVKSMMQLEKSPASPHFVGLKTLMKTPKISERHMDPEGYFSADIFASPVQEFSQDTTQSVAHEKRSESVIEPTSSKADATTTARSGNIVSETPPRTTRSRRKAPEDSVEPVPKRVCRTRATVKQQNEGKTETRSNSKVAQKKTAVKSQKKTAAVIQDTPKPFVFKRTKLDPIIEVQSPLPTLDDAIEITTSSSLCEEPEKASNRERKTGNAPKTRKQSNAPLRQSRRGNRCKAPAETPVEEFTRQKLAEQHLVTMRKKTETVAEDSTNTGDSQERKGERKRTTRNNKANENSLDTMAPKTRMTRNQRAEIADVEEEEVDCSFIDEAVINPAPRRGRSVAKTAKKNAQVLGKSKPTRSTDREETHDEAAHYVPEVRSTRASRKQANESKVVENDNTRGKNKGKEEVKELKKEATTIAIKKPRGAGSASRTRGNPAQKADIEGHDGSLVEEKEVRPDKSSNKPRAKRELKQSTTNASRETRSTRSRKPAEDKVDFTEQSVHSKVGTKRSRQENAGTPPPEPKRTRASVRAQSGPTTRITRSTSRK